MPSESSATATPHVPPKLAFVLLLAGLSTLGPISIDLFLPAVPTIVRALHTDAGHTQLTFSLFMMGLACGQFFFGPLADRIGRRPTLLIGLVIFLAGCIGCTFAPNIETLIACRLLQGFGGSSSRAVVPAIVRDTTSGRDTARLLSYVGSIVAAAPLIGPFIGGYLLQLGSWRLMFGVMGVAAVLLLIATLMLFPETASNVQAARRRVLPDAMRFLTDRRCIVPTLISGFGLTGLMAYVSGSSYVIIELMGVSPQVFGWYFATTAMTLMAAARFNIRLLRRRGMAQVMRTGLLLMMAGAATMVATHFLRLEGTPGAMAFAGPMVIYALGIALVASNATSLALQPMGDMAGSASALNGGVVLFMGATGAAIVGLFPHDMAASITGAVVVGAVAAFVTFTLLYPAHLKTQTGD